MGVCALTLIDVRRSFPTKETETETLNPKLHVHYTEIKGGRAPFFYFECTLANEIGYAKVAHTMQHRPAAALAPNPYTT